MVEAKYKPGELVEAYEIYNEGRGVGVVIAVDITKLYSYPERTVVFYDVMWISNSEPKYHFKVTKEYQNCLRRYDG